MAFGWEIFRDECHLLSERRRDPPVILPVAVDQWTMDPEDEYMTQAEHLEESGAGQVIASTEDVHGHVTSQREHTAWCPGQHVGAE